MKKNIALIMLLSILILKSQAQDSFSQQPNILIGVKAIVGQSADPAITPDYEPADGYGLQVIQHMHKKIFFETGIYSIQKTLGTNSYYFNYSNQTLYEYDYPVFQYLRIPLNVRLETKSIYISSGFDADYYLGMENSYTRNIGASNNTMQLAFNINLGLQKNINSKLNVFMEIGASFGITPAFKDNSLQEGGGFLNYGFALGLNYKIK